MDKNILKRLGLKIGHYTDLENLTGLSAFICEEGADIGIDIRGSNTGTLNTPNYDPKSASRLVHSVVLTGGSTYGLESAFGVMQYLEQKRIGYVMRGGLVVPGMTGSCMYDIAIGNNVKPTKENGYNAARIASDEELSQGNVGVGTGATVGKWFKGKRMKGGLGIGIKELPGDVIVVSFAVTNSIGDIINPKNNQFYSETGKQEMVNNDLGDDLNRLSGLLDLGTQNTTLALIATNAVMNKTQLMKVAELAHDGMARAIHPIHTNMDGDIIFALSSHSGDRKELPMSEITLIDIIGLAAADATVKAINNSIKHAKGVEGFPAFEQNKVAE
jgi:L-aminopeptidase/D-esterase-like protein